MSFIIGDIHGELTKLKSLLNAIILLNKEAKLIFIGDYLDKGEDPFATLEYLQKLAGEREVVFLRGNHEYMWELLKSNDDEYAGYVLEFGGKNTISSAGKKEPLETKKLMMDRFGPFFSSLKDYYVIGDFIATHSGIPPRFWDTAIEKIPGEKLYFNRYDFFKQERTFQGKKVVFGHTGFYSPFYDGYKIGVDTAACYLPEQPLTAFCTEGNFFINSSNDKILLSQIELNRCPVIPRIKPWRQQ